MNPEPPRSCFAPAPTPCPLHAECLCIRPLDHAGLCYCAACGRFYKGQK